MTSLQQQTFNLENKTILVTGAGSGLGRHFALTLAQAGAFVILSGRRLEPLQQLALEIESLGGRSASYCMDVTDFSSLKQHVNTLFELFVKIDVLVNNAGQTSSVKKEPYDFELAEWDDIMNTNVKAVWALSNLVAKKMIDLQLPSSVINISSANAQRPRPTNALYCISKSSVNAMTEVLAMEYAKHKIRFNCIAPGIMGVGMSQKAPHTPAGQELISKMPMGRAGTPQELDGALLLLASDASSYMTGNCLSVDGGYVTKAIL